MTFLQGKKTYVLGVLAVLYAVAGFFTGNLDGNTAMGIAWAALSTMSIRHGISTTASANTN